MLACMLSAGCKGGGRDLSSPTAPSNPQNTNFSGTWTGTMTRPSDLGSIAVRWTMTQNAPNVTGPSSMTYNGVTIDAVMAGSWGSDREEPVISFIRIERPANATSLPACSMFAKDLEFKGFRPTSTTLTSSTFTIEYGNCQGFIAPDPQLAPRLSRSETSQMTLNKQ